MMPRMESFSASARSAMASMESLKARFIVLADWLGSSSTRVTTPVSSCSQRMVVLSVMSVLLRKQGWPGDGQRRSMTVATPMPPPTQRVTRP